MFQNPHDEQIPKLLLGVEFDQEFLEKPWETICCKLPEVYCITPDIEEDVQVNVQWKEWSHCLAYLAYLHLPHDPDDSDKTLSSSTR